MTKVIWIIQCYEEKSESGVLSDNAVCEVYARNEKEALNKAKKYIKKANYRVSQVIEK